MRKKLLRTLIVFFGLILLLLAMVPLVFRSGIDDLIKKNVNNNITGTFDFDRSNVSLFRNFPNISVTLEDIALKTSAPFEGDTLLLAGEAGIVMGIGEIFKGQNQPVTVKSLFIEDADLFLEVDNSGNPNYDIAVEDENSENSGFTFQLDGYTIRDARIYYDNRETDISLAVEDIQHSGEGDLSLDDTELETTTNGLISFSMDGVNYLSRNPVNLEALIGIDFQEQKYSFLENNAYINQLPLVFKGYVQVFEDYNDVAITFSTPDSDFRNFLAVVPEEYAKNLDRVETSGTFKVLGALNGRADDTYIPKIDIEISSENASFKFPELPKAVNNIQIAAQVINRTGIAEDTYVSIDQVSFAIDGQPFNLSARISDLLGITRVNSSVKGILDLGKLEQVYPLEAFSELKGILDADVKADFDMEAVENKHYDRINTAGTAQLSDFSYSSPEFKEPVAISMMNLEFTPQRAELKQLSGSIGESDFNATGRIENILGYMFRDEKIKGLFNLQSNTLVLDDFITEKASDEPSSTEGLKIPSFLDCAIRANIANIFYDDLLLKSASGTLNIRDSKATIDGMDADFLGGKIRFSGAVSTREAVPDFEMKLNFEELGIGQAFENIKLLRVLAPVASALEGELSSEIAIDGSLMEDLNLDLSTITGGALAELTTAEMNAQQAKVLNALAGKLNFLKPENFNLTGLKTALTFEDGYVRVAPFSYSYNDIDMVVEGGHSFDAALDYNITLEVPAKYLGSEVNNLIAKIGEEELNDLTIPVVANVSGGYTSPKVSTDLTSGVRDLTARLVEIQKQKLIDQGTEKTKDLLEGLIGKKDRDTLQRRDTTGSTVRDVVKDLFKRQDTVNSTDTTRVEQDPVEKAAKGVLGGILRRKVRDTTSKDSIN